MSALFPKTAIIILVVGKNHFDNCSRENIYVTDFLNTNTLINNTKYFLQFKGER